MISLLGFPYDNNSSFLKGPSLAPAKIRQLLNDDCSNSFSESGIDSNDPNIFFDAGDLTEVDSSATVVFERIKLRVKEELKKNNKIISFGGDHSITFPVIESFATKYSDLKILHIDAHSDLYDEYNNNKLSHACPFARIMEKGLARSLTQIGIRTLNTHQREQAAKYNVNIVEMKDWTDTTTLDLDGPLYISFDMDALDPAFAPGVSHHEPGGFTTRQIITLIQNINVPVVGVDIVEYNPLRDINDMTGRVACKLFKEFIARLLEQ